MGHFSPMFSDLYWVQCSIAEGKESCLTGAPTVRATVNVLPLNAMTTSWTFKRHDNNFDLWLSLGGLPGRHNFRMSLINSLKGADCHLSFKNLCSAHSLAVLCRSQCTMCSSSRPMLIPAAGLVHQPPALVGPPHPCLVRVCITSGGSSLREGRQRALRGGPR